MAVIWANEDLIKPVQGMHFPPPSGGDVIPFPAGKDKRNTARGAESKSSTDYVSYLERLYISSTGKQVSEYYDTESQLWIALNLQRTAQ